MFIAPCESNFVFRVEKASVDETEILSYSIQHISFPPGSWSIIYNR